MPPGKDAKDEKEDDLDQRTKEAVRDVLKNPAYAGKTVIMVWEHKRIASEDHNKDRDEPVEALAPRPSQTPPPAKWEGENYNFFWIVTYELGKAGEGRHFPTTVVHR